MSLRHHRRRGNSSTQSKIQQDKLREFRNARPDHNNRSNAEIAAEPTIAMTKKEDSPGYAQRMERKRRQQPTYGQKGLLRRLEEAAGEEHVNCANKLICEIRIDTMKRQIVEMFGPDALAELLVPIKDKAEQNRQMRRYQVKRRNVARWGNDHRAMLNQGKWRSNDA